MRRLLPIPCALLPTIALALAACSQQEGEAARGARTQDAVSAAALDAGPEGFAPGPNGDWILGEIRNHREEPLAGARIVWGGATTRSDSAGAFALRLPRGEPAAANFLVTCPGYAGSFVSVERWQRQVVHLDDSGFLHFRVEDPERRLLAGTEAELSLLRGSIADVHLPAELRERWEGARFTADDLGRIAIPSPPAHSRGWAPPVGAGFCLRFRRTGFADSWLQLPSHLACSPSSPIEVVLEPSQQNPLRVVDAHGKPVAGADVELLGQVQVRGVTGADGRPDFPLPQQQEAGWFVRVDGGDHGVWISDGWVDLVEGEPFEVVLSGPRRVAGRVTAADPRDLRFLRVATAAAQEEARFGEGFQPMPFPPDGRFAWQDYARRTWSNPKSVTEPVPVADDGSFEFESPLCGPLTAVVVFAEPGRSFVAGALLTEGAETVLEVPDLALLRGRVSVPDEVQLERCSLLWQDDPYESPHWAALSDGGRFEVVVPKQTVELRLDGLAGRLYEPREVAVSEELVEAELALDELRRLDVRAVAGGAPAAHTELFASWGADEQRGSARATTDGGGWARFAAVGNGPVRVSGPGRNQAAEVPAGVPVAELRWPTRSVVLRAVGVAGAEADVHFDVFRGEYPVWGAPPVHRGSVQAGGAAEFELPAGPYWLKVRPEGLWESPAGFRVGRRPVDLQLEGRRRSLVAVDASALADLEELEVELRYPNRFDPSRTVRKAVLLRHPGAGGVVLEPGTTEAQLVLTAHCRRGDPPDFTERTLWEGELQLPAGGGVRFVLEPGDPPRVARREPVR